MNIGLIILVTSLFVGAEDNNDQPAEIKKPNSERVTTNEEVVKNKISINQSDEIPQNTSGIDKSVNKKNSPPIIQGEPRVKINQDEYYSFTPLVNDPENDKLEFDITNKPQWAIFDSRTGTLFGQPTDKEIGKVISVEMTFNDLLANKSTFLTKLKPLKSTSIPPTVIDKTVKDAKYIGGEFKIKEKLSAINLKNHYKEPISYEITEFPTKGILLNGDNGQTIDTNELKSLEVIENLIYKRTKPGKDNFEYKGKRQQILSLKPAIINISYANKAPVAKNFRINAVIETETTSIPFVNNITDDQELIKGIMITKNPQQGSLYIDDQKIEVSNPNKIIDIKSEIIYKSNDTNNSSDSFSYRAFDTDDESSFERTVFIELKQAHKAQQKSNGFVLLNARTPKNPILQIERIKPKVFNVCWGENINGITNAALSIFKNEVKQIIADSWTKYAMLDFIGWGNCITDSQETTTRIEFTNSGVSYYSKNKIVFSADTVNRLSKSTVIHEFGHLLGLIHENERYDTYRYGSVTEDNREKYCKHMMPGWPRQFDMQDNKFLEEYKTKLEFDYDPYSIMNYCNNFYPKGKLSLTDIRKVQKKYGARADSIINLKEKPFTGFYNNGSDNFVYFQDGKHQTSSGSVSFMLNSNEDTKYFNVKHSNGMNTLADYSQKETLQDKVLIPLSNNPISICKTELNTTVSGVVTPLSQCKVFQKKDYIGYRPYYFNSKSNAFNQVTKSFCQELQGEETPWSKSNNWTPKQYFVSLTNCIDIPAYFNVDGNWRLYFKGVGYSGRIKDLEGFYFIDGVLFEDQYKTEQGVLYKYNFHTQLRSYKNFDNHGEMHSKYTGLYKGNYYLDGLLAESHDHINEFDENGLPVNDDFSISENKLYKNGFTFTGLNPSKIGETNGHYINGSNYEFEVKLQIVNGKIYRYHNNEDLFKTNILHPILGYQYNDNATSFSKLRGFNPTSLGNGINSYYTQGYPTTILCKNSGQCSNKNDSVNDIYQLFKDVDLDEIYAWIEVATQYSRYGESLNYSGKAEDVVPILFKGNNPYSGEFNGNTYWKGYMQ